MGEEDIDVWYDDPEDSLDGGGWLYSFVADGEEYQGGPCESRLAADEEGSWKREELTT